MNILEYLGVKITGEYYIEFTECPMCLNQFLESEKTLLVDLRAGTMGCSNCRTMVFISKHELENIRKYLNKDTYGEAK
jgi:hypothetical protein